MKEYTTKVEQKQLGYHLDALAEIDIQTERCTRILEGLRNRKEVMELHSASDKHTITARCWFRNTVDMVEFTRELEQKQGVLKVTPAIIVERVKKRFYLSTESKIYIVQGA